MILTVVMKKGEPKTFEDVEYEEVARDGVGLLEITYEGGKIERIPLLDIEKYFKTGNGNVGPLQP